MRDSYGVTYSKRQAQLFTEWDKQDSVSEEDVLLDKKIQKVQGIGNHYVLDR
jgi:endonuclease I